MQMQMQMHRVQKLTVWAWFSKHQTSTSSQPIKSSNSKMVEAFPILACPATRTTTKWTVSVQRSPSARTSTLSSRLGPRTRTPNSRPSTTSWSRRSSNTIKWWANRARTVSRCWTHAQEVASPTSCRVTTIRRLCIRTIMVMDSSCRTANKPRRASTPLITTNMSTVYLATPSTRPRIFPSSRIELKGQFLRQLGQLAYLRAY